jgi:hypothetical protein
MAPILCSRRRAEHFLDLFLSTLAAVLNVNTFRAVIASTDELDPQIRTQSPRLLEEIARVGTSERNPEGVEEAAHLQQVDLPSPCGVFFFLWLCFSSMGMLYLPWLRPRSSPARRSTLESRA